MTTPNHPTYQQLLDFWFAEGMEQKWYGGGTEFDEELRSKYLALHTAARNEQLKAWEDSREGRLALVIVLDQFSRNLYRGTPDAFAGDAQALAASKRALCHGDDLWLKDNHPDSWRSFLYMPLMHSENLEDQRRCLDLFLTHGPERNIPFARSHMDVIYRFGRFPGRNKALGRETTPEESAFLETGRGNW